LNVADVHAYARPFITAGLGRQWSCRTRETEELHDSGEREELQSSGDSGATGLDRETYSIGTVRLEFDVLCFCNVAHDHAARARSGGADGNEHDEGHGRYDGIEQHERIPLHSHLFLQLHKPRFVVTKFKIRMLLH
jgi:hypothetical protein